MNVDNPHENGVNRQMYKEETAIFQKHFLLSAFCGTFLTAVLFQTAFLLWLGSANAAFAAVLNQCRSTVSAVKMENDRQTRAQAAGAVNAALLHINRYNSQILECDRRLEQGLADWQKGNLTLEGLEMLALSNQESLSKMRERLQDYTLSAELRAADHSRLKEAGGYLLRRLDKSLYRQEHISQLLGDLKTGKLKYFPGLYAEDTLKYMCLVKALEYEYSFVYKHGAYQAGDRLPTVNALGWVLLAQRGKAFEKNGELARAQEVYTALTKQSDRHSRGAGYMLLAALQKRQGDYDAYQEMLRAAEQYWPGAANDDGEYGACRRQGLI